MTGPLVTIIIPAYNASKYINETLNSVLEQSFSDFEILIIDDGSTDDLCDKVRQFKDERILYYYQENKGVSAARNFGFSKAKGKYVVFFDADDVMGDNFLQSRLAELECDDRLNFVCGKVLKFSDHKHFEKVFKGTTVNGINEILHYDQNIVTCPSNYMFRTEFLSEYQILYNIRLSSTADRMFLIQCHNKGFGEFKEKAGVLFYRVNCKSMSHLLTPLLVNDNAIFYKVLLEKDLIRQHDLRLVLTKGYYIIAASYFKLGYFFKALVYAFKSAFYYTFRFK
jgi:glycosyltransferase involved in cell wall biosynthesis